VDVYRLVLRAKEAPRASLWRRARAVLFGGLNQRLQRRRQRQLFLRIAAEMAELNGGKLPTLSFALPTLPYLELPTLPTASEAAEAFRDVAPRR
jgi:hypothetical protein